MPERIKLEQSLLLWLCLLIAATTAAVVLVGPAALAAIVAIALCASAWRRWFSHKPSVPSGIILVALSLVSSLPFYSRGLAGVLFVALSSYLAGATVVLYAVIRKRRRFRSVRGEP
jgi:ABC-type enterochelin transport system permease subunit